MTSSVVSSACPAEAADDSKLINGCSEDSPNGFCHELPISKSTEYTLDGTLDWNGQPALRSKTGGWKSAKYIIGQQLFSNLPYFGVSKNLVIYLTTVMHEGTATAANFVSNWTGAVFIAPLLGALLADTYWGRYSTTLIFSAIFALGTTLVAVGAYVPSMHPTQCPSRNFRCENATYTQSTFLTLGLYISGIGSGALQSPITALGADQFDEEDEKEKNQKGSFFNWFYQAITLGAMVAAIAIVTVQEQVSWGLGMALSAGSTFVALILFVLGSRLYRLHKPGGNSLVRISQVFVAAAKKWRIKGLDVTALYELPDNERLNEGRKILHTDDYKFLDRAAVQTEFERRADGFKTSPWKLCTVTQIEEVKCLIRFCPIFLTSVLYTTVYMQLSTLFVIQGATMDTGLFCNIKIAPATISVIENISVVFWVVIYDQLMVPFIRKYTRHPRGLTALQRIGVGLALSAVAMAVAALVERKRLDMAKHYGLLDNPDKPIPMSVLWEIPQYFIIGASEIFTYIGLLEFFYEQSPDAIRSVGSALSLFSNAIGSYISTFLVTLVNSITSKGGEYSRWIPDNLNRGHVDRFYWLLAVLSLVNLVAFVICARSYRYLRQEPLPIKHSQVNDNMTDMSKRLSNTVANIVRSISAEE